MAADATREMATNLAHLYRGEISRADAWRARLDNTTNWALTTTAAVISFGLGSAGASHAVFLFGMFLVTNFLVIEVRRYRAWDVYLRRVRILETRFYASMLRGEPLETRHLRELASMLEAPRVVMPVWQALGQRIRRAYGPVLLVLLSAWIKLMVRPRTGEPAGFIDRMRIGFIPGVVLIAVTVTGSSLIAVAVWSLWVSPPPTELAASRPRPRSLRSAFERGTAGLRLRTSPK